MGVPPATIRPAKITPPRLASVMARERIWQRLDAAGPGVAVWLQAPAGFGKTMAVAGWLQARGHRPVWYRTDEGDGDPASVFGYLAQALPADPAGAAGQTGQRLPTFSADFRLALSTFAQRWFERWWALQATGSSEAPVLVFDDYQEAGDVGLHHEVLRCAIERLPAQGRLLVISRQAPPPGLVRLLTSGELLHLEPGLISLDETEATELARRRDPALSVEGAQALGQACRGWAAGLVLMMQSGAWAPERAAPSVRAAPAASDASAASNAAAHHAALPVDEAGSDRLFDFFAQEVVRRLPEASRQLLALAAWMPVALSEVLALAAADVGLSEMAEGAACAEVLDALHRSGTFTLRVDRAEAAYQFHPLFQGYLRSAEGQGTDAARVRARRAAVARALLARGHAEEAVGVALGAQDWAMASSLIVELRESLSRQGRQRTLLRWLEELPAESIQANAWLLHARGDSRCLLADAAGMPDLRAAIDRFEAEDEHDGLALSLHALALALISRPESNPAAVEPLIDRMAALLERWRGSPVARMWLLRAVTTSRWFSAPADPRMDGWLTELRAIAEAAGTPEAMALWLHPEFLVALARGHHDRVIAGLRVLDAVEARLREPNLQAFCRFLRLYALNKLGRFEEAVSAFRVAAQAAQEEGALIWAYQISMHGVESLIGAGQIAPAKALLAQLHQQVPVERGFAGIFYCLLAGWLALARGDLDEALAVTLRHEALLETADVQLFGVLAPLSRGWVHLARREPGPAVEALQRAHERAREPALGVVSTFLQFDSLLALSQALHERGDPGDPAASAAALAAALELGRPHRYSTVYYARPADLSPILHRALQAGVETSYVRHIIRVRGLPAPAELPVDWNWPLRIRTLGTFAIEREVDGVIEPLKFGAKTPKKLLLLLKAVIALGGHEVPEDRVMDAVWPELDADQAQAALKTAVSRLNALLGEPGGWVAQRGGLLMLDRARLWVDVWALERRLERPDADGLSNLYRGPFLPADTDQPWSLAPRERWRQRVQAVLAARGAALQAQGELDGALRCVLEGFELDPLSESLAVQAMRLLLALERRLEGVAVFERLKEALGRDLGLRPSAAAITAHRDLIQG